MNCVDDHLFCRRPASKIVLVDSGLRNLCFSILYNDEGIRPESTFSDCVHEEFVSPARYIDKVAEAGYRRNRHSHIFEKQFCLHRVLLHVNLKFKSCVFSASPSPFSFRPSLFSLGASTNKSPNQAAPPLRLKPNTQQTTPTSTPTHPKEKPTATTTTTKPRSRQQ